MPARGPTSNALSQDRVQPPGIRLIGRLALVSRRCGSPPTLASPKQEAFRGRRQRRYIVDDVDTALAFYVSARIEELHPRRPAPVELITGVGGEQVVIDDPSGNPVELFEPTRAEARLTEK